MRQRETERKRERETERVCGKIMKVVIGHNHINKFTLNISQQ